MSQQVKTAAKLQSAKQAEPSSPTRKSASSSITHSPIEQILYLQRTLGNRTTQKLFHSGLIQAKLRISRPNDIYEQEADRIADQVMRMPGSAVKPKPT